MAGGQDVSFRRRSFGFFSKPTITPEMINSRNSAAAAAGAGGTSPVGGGYGRGGQDRANEEEEKPLTLRARPKSFFGGSGTGGFFMHQEVSTTITADGKQKISLRSRPRSMFGSLKGRGGGENLESSNTSSSNSLESKSAPPAEVSKVILYCGEAMSTGGLLRRKKEYFVLTDSELLRFKSQLKAVEQLGFSDGNGKSTMVARTPSYGSIPDTTTQQNIVTKLSQVVAVYQPKTVETDLVSTTIQIDHLDDSDIPLSTTLQLATPLDAQKWLLNLTKATYNVQIEQEDDISPDLLQYVIRRLDAACDYDPKHFKIYRVSQRGGKSSKPTSADDLSKLYSTAGLLAFGFHKVHIFPIPKPTSNKSTSALRELASGSSFSCGILNITNISMSFLDDSFSLTFRKPFSPPQTIHLASSHVVEIIQQVRQRCDFLRPEWLVAPFTLNIPEYLTDIPLESPEDKLAGDHGCFDRTLTAFCESRKQVLKRHGADMLFGAAYSVDVSNIAYEVRYDVEDAPLFVLHPPVHSRRKHYNDLELLAVLRALRWNESFASISFGGNSLDALKKMYDNHGSEHEPQVTRSNQPFMMKGKHSVLIHELRALAISSTRLRRMDFSGCTARKNRNSGDFTLGGIENEEGCGFVEALMPLCRRGLTNVDWFVFNGIDLVEADLDWLVDAAAARLAHFRGFEMRRCGLTERMMGLFLNALAVQENTLECLDLSGNPGRIHPPILHDSMSYFPFLRKLSLSRVMTTSGAHPLLSAEVLLRWRLESLDLSETHLNKESVDAIGTYLVSEQSDSLHHLDVTQCGLTSKEVAVLLHSMCRNPGVARNLHLYASQNQLAKSHDKLVDCIEHSITPLRMTLRMIDYQKEEPFRELLYAIARNKTLEYLDISKVSLPYDASDETCSVLRDLFERNTSLKHLDISGEHAVIETSTLGAGLSRALSGLAKNTTLEVLRVEHQSLGSTGALILAEILGKNSTLRELHCSKNKITLQGFTALVDATKNNTALLYLPSMDQDRAERLKEFKESLKAATEPRPDPPSVLRPSTLKKRVGGALKSSTDRRVSFRLDPPSKLTGRPTLNRMSSVSVDDVVLSSMGMTGSGLERVVSQKEADELIKMIEGRWLKERERLGEYLERNAEILGRSMWGEKLEEGAVVEVF